MKPAFAPGDRVRVRALDPQGHYRTPYYLHGRRGVVTRLVGDQPNPEELACHRIGVPFQPVYTVAFEFEEVWGRRDPAVTITADIFQHWLEGDGAR